MVAETSLVNRLTGGLIHKDGDWSKYGSSFTRLDNYLVEDRLLDLPAYVLLSPLILMSRFSQRIRNIVGDALGYGRCPITGDTYYGDSYDTVWYKREPHNHKLKTGLLVSKRARQLPTDELVRAVYNNVTQSGKVKPEETSIELIMKMNRLHSEPIRGRLVCSVNEYGLAETCGIEETDASCTKCELDWLFHETL